MKVRMANRRSPELVNFEVTSGYRNIDVRKTLIYLCKSVTHKILLEGIPKNSQVVHQKGD